MIPYFDSDMVLHYIRKPVGSWLDVVQYEWVESLHPRGQPENAGEFVSKEEMSSKTKRAPPGSQMSEETRSRLRAVGMVGTFPPAEVPVANVKVADLSKDKESLKYEALMSWDQPTKSGRVSRQYRYTQAFHDRNAGEKWERVQRIEPHMEKIAKNLTAKMSDAALPMKQREGAAIASLIRETGLRPTDGDESIKHGHFGISSIQARHATIQGNEVHLDFIGKEGMRNQTVVKEPENVAFLKNTLKGKSGNDFVFAHADSKDAGTMLKAASKEAGGPEDIMVKDLRTVKATQMGEQVVKGFKGPPPPLTGKPEKDVKLIKKAILEMSGVVSKVLCNSAEMARENYIHPRIWADWQTKLGVDAGQISQS